MNLRKNSYHYHKMREKLYYRSGGGGGGWGEEGPNKSLHFEIVVRNMVEKQAIQNDNYIGFFFES